MNYIINTRHITVVTSDMSEQHAIFGSGAYRISSREMWRELKENEVVVNKSLDDFSEKKPRIRIPLSNEILEEFEKIRRGKTEKTNFVVILDRFHINHPTYSKG